MKTLGGRIDDFQSMREAVSRRYSRLYNEEKEMPDLIMLYNEEKEMPDLIMVDGGKGQVHAAIDELEALGLDYIPVVGLAEKNEEIVFPDGP